MITGEDRGGASGSGSGGGDGDVRTESPPRDSAKGKGPAVAEETSGEVPMEPVEFIPAAGYSGHMPITRGNFAEFVDEGVLERLLRENPAVAAAILGGPRGETESCGVGPGGGEAEGRGRKG